MDDVHRFSKILPGGRVIVHLKGMLARNLELTRSPQSLTAASKSRIQQTQMSIAKTNRLIEESRRLIEFTDAMILRLYVGFAPR